MGFRLRRFVDWWRYDFPRGLGNLWRWFPVVWYDFDWDQEPLLRVMLFKMRRMEEGQRKYSNHLHSGRYARQLAVCIRLLERLLKDEYAENIAGWPGRDFTRDSVRLVAKQEQADQEMLGRMISKHLSGWWW